MIIAFKNLNLLTKQTLLADMTYGRKFTNKMIQLSPWKYVQKDYHKHTHTMPEASFAEIEK